MGLSSPLRLDNALKTGMLTPPEDGGTCTSHLVVGTDMRVFVSKELGLSSIFLERYGQTVKGIRVSAARDHLVVAYPNLEQPKEDSPYWTSTAVANPKAVYSFSFEEDKVNSVTLDLVDQDCHS